MVNGAFVAICDAVYSVIYGVIYGISAITQKLLAKPTIIK